MALPERPRAMAHHGYGQQKETGRCRVFAGQEVGEKLMM
jgi:hypothetical protein